MMREIFNNSLSSLYCWLDTRESNGGYHGFVLHRYNSRRVLLNNPTCWAQGPIICGLVNMAKENKKYEIKLKKAVQYQIDLLDKQNGKYSFCGHEDDRFSSLIQCSLANEGLLESYNYFKSIDDSFAKEILKTVEINIDTYLITLWNDEYKAFKFNDIDFLSRDGDRFVANMNVMFIYTLIVYSKTIKTTKYDSYIAQTLDWIISQQITSDNKYLDGGFTYQQKVGVAQKMQNPVVIYNGIIAEYLAKIYKYYPEDRFKTVLERVEEYLWNNYDDGTNTFYHDYMDDRLLKYPRFIAGSAFVIKGLYELNRVLKKENNRVLELLQVMIKKYQYENGGFRGFLGYNSNDNRHGCCNSDLEVWEDIVPTFNWNSKMFELLSGLGHVKEIRNYNSRLFLVNWNYIYFENDNKVFIFGLFPLRSFAILFYSKKIIKPIFTFSLLDFYVKIRGLK